MTIREALQDPAIVAAGVDAVEATLIGLRNGRVSIVNARRGLVIENRNDRVPGSLIRMTVEDAVRIALAAVACEIERRGV